MRSLAALLLSLAFALAACDAGEVTLVAPQKTTSATAALTVHATLGEPYADLAAALGWQAGIPGAHVRIHNSREPYDEDYWVTGQTDATGTAAFPDLLEGIYEVEITRTLTDDEVARAGTASRIVAGGRWLHAPRDAVREIPLTPNQRKGLVFGEIALIPPPGWEIGDSYHSAEYIELFNNSDATVWLDGMILGFGWYFWRDYGGWPCTLSEPFRTDPDGIWARSAARFPGSGHDYPVAPGATALIAKSAIDHTSVHWSLSDLSEADFELPIGGGAGNPDVPDLVQLGPIMLYPSEPNTTFPLFLSEPVDLASLPTRADPNKGFIHLRYPRDGIVDAVLVQYDFAKSSYEAAPFCSQALDPFFEALPGPAVWESSDGDGAAWTAQRRVIGHENGRPILQDTNTSMADFVRAWKTPGTTPDSGPGGP